MAIVFRGRVFSVEVERRCFPNGREHEITVVRHPPSVVLIPIDDVGRVVLVRQYRASVDRELWELPAGSLERGESAEAAAARECEEEIGEELIYFRLSGLRAPAPTPSTGRTRTKTFARRPSRWLTPGRWPPAARSSI